MTINASRRRLVRALGAAAIWPLAAPALAAEPWPTRPVTVLCPFAADTSTDTSTDTLMRLINAAGHQASETSSRSSSIKKAQSRVQSD